MPYGDGTYGTCEYSGSVFKLDADAAVTAEETRKKEPPAKKKAPSGGDLKRLFQSFYEGLDNGDRMELGKDLCFVGFLQTHKKKEAQARQHFFRGEDSAQPIYLVLDTTMFGSGKKGLAVTDQGIFYDDDGDDDGKMERDESAQAKFRRSSGRIEINGRDPCFIADEGPACILMACMQRFQGQRALPHALLRRGGRYVPLAAFHWMAALRARILEIGVNEWLPLRGHTT